MNEDVARGWVIDRFGPAAADRLDAFATLLLKEAQAQNLIAASTADQFWVRHLLDSAQLVRHRPSGTQRWLDVGAGAGLPGLVLALLLPQDDFTLVEPRRRRVAFLQHAADELQLANVRIAMSKVERHQDAAFDIITARAVAPAGDLLLATTHLRTHRTTYVLPRGQSGIEEVETLRNRWQGLFHVEHSLTEPSSTILVASGVA